MNSLRVTNKDLYVIEVNDNGDTIEIAKNDVDLPLKVAKCHDDIQKIVKRLEDLDKLERGEIKEGQVFTDSEIEEFTTFSECYSAMRKAVDRLLGEGACQKIFGDNNWLEMFDDLFEALQPHFEAMGVTSFSRTVEAIDKKYGDKEEVL